MPKKIIATPEAVATAVEQLVAESLEPTLERVRAKLGGGSYTTINRVLTEVIQGRGGGDAKAADIPPDLIEIGHKAVSAVYRAVQQQTKTTVEAIEAEARRQIEAAQATKASAALEIERLERELDANFEELEQARRDRQEAQSRAERAEARGEQQHIEIQRLAEELRGARSELDMARTSARTAEASLRQEAEGLHRTIARMDASLAAAQDRQQRDAELLNAAAARVESAQSQVLAATARAERAETGSAGLSSSLEGLRAELAALRDSERAAREAASELRGALQEQYRQTAAPT